MKQFQLPGTDLTVSRYTLGTMMFGGKTPAGTSLALIDRAFGDGINFLDTADSYNNGRSEEVVGQAIKGRRAEFVVATKVYYPMHDGDSHGTSRARMEQHLEESLRRLDTEYIDILYLHQPDYDTPIEETVLTLGDFIRSGKVRYYGVSNFAAWQIADLIAAARRLDVPAPVVTQNVYNVITRGIEQELIPFTQALGLSVYAYNPIAGGLLTGKYSADEVDPDGRLVLDKNYQNRYLTEHNLRAVAALNDVAREAGRSLLEYSLLFAAQTPGITSLILGFSRIEQYRENSELLAGKPLSTDEYEAFRKVSDQYFNRGFAYNR